MLRLAVLTMSHVLMDCLLNVVPPLIPFLARDFGWSLAKLGTVAMVASLSTGLLQPFLGVVVDRLNRAWPFPWTLVWVAVFVAAFGWAESYLALLVMATLWGIGGAFFHPLASVIVPRAAKRLAGARATAMSVFSFGGTLGIALAPIVFTLLITAYGRRGTGFVLIVALLVAAVNIAAGTSRIAVKKSDEELSQEEARVGEIEHGGVVDQPRALFWLCAGMTLRLVVFRALLNFLPLLYVERGFDEKSAGLLLTGFLFVGSLGSILGGRLADHLGRKAVTVYSAFLITPGLWAFFFFSGALSLVGLGFAALTMYASFSAVVVYAQELMPSRAATAAGLVMGFVWALASFSVPLTGALADWHGLEWTLRSVTWVPILAGAVMMVVPETLDKSALSTRSGTAA